MASDFLSALKFDHVDEAHNLVMMQFSNGFSIDLHIWNVAPCSVHSVVLLVLVLRHQVRDNITNQVEFLVSLCQQIICFIGQISLLFLFGFGLFDEVLALIFTF